MHVDGRGGNSLLEDLEQTDRTMKEIYQIEFL